MNTDTSSHLVMDMYKKMNNNLFDIKRITRKKNDRQS